MPAEPSAEKKPEELHNDTFIFDYYPLGLPLMVDDEMRSYMNEALSGECNGNAVVYEFFNFYLTRMERGGETGRAMREKLERAVAETGVNLIALTLGNASRPLDDYDSIMASLLWWERLLKVFPVMGKCTAFKDIDSHYRKGRVGVMFALQDMGCIGGDLERIDQLFEKGVRMGQLTYNRANLIGHGCAEHPEKGLTIFGKDAVKRMNRLGMVVDLSHCNSRTTMEGIEFSDSPAAVSHSSCKAVWNHGRAKSDEELKALAEKGGYFGVYTVPFFLGDDPFPDFGIFLKHLEHAADVAGIDKVGIGTDWGLWSPDVPRELMEVIIEAAYKMGFSRDMNLSAGSCLKGFDDYTKWISITRALLSAGWSRNEITGILGGNFLNFLKRVNHENSDN